MPLGKPAMRIAPALSCRHILFGLAITAGAVAVPVVVRGADEQPCTNGSFEQLASNGFPADWVPVGKGVEVSSDAHFGQRSLRLLRSADGDGVETGVNRANRRSGAANATGLIDRLKGGIDFWYKAVSADRAELNVYVIPMTERLLEYAGGRATYTVPAEHVGDGQWHHARLKYDFTGQPDVRFVHFAARIVGRSGELLLDDVSYVERVGAVLRFNKPRLEEDLQQPGRRATLFADVENVGDEMARELAVSLKLPTGLEAALVKAPMGELSPGARAIAAWLLEGARTDKAVVRLAATARGVQCSSSLPIAAGLAIRSFGAVRPVGMEGRPLPIECLLQNTGNAILVAPHVEFGLPDGRRTVVLDDIPPGQTRLATVDLIPGEQTLEQEVAVSVRAASAAEPISAATKVVVGAAGDLPAPSGKLQAVATDGYAILENELVRLAFRNNRFGFGPAELAVATAEGWQAVAWLPRLSRLVCRGENEQRQDIVITASRGERLDDPVGLRFQWSDSARGCVVEVRFTLGEGENTINVEHLLEAGHPLDVLAFEGPMIYALDRQEAVFPGLEWLVDDELSSSALDIAEDHADRIRYVPHPNLVTIPAIGVAGKAGTVGLVWDVHQRWDGQRDRPAAVFASPDRFGQQRSHLMGVFLPTVPEFVDPNQREAARPYRLNPNEPVRLRSRIVADGRTSDPLSAVDAWVAEHNFPPPAPIPRGSYENEIEFSMRAYLDSLWFAETKEWWTTKGGGPMSKKGRPTAFVADLLVGEMLSPDVETRRRCRERAEEVVSLIGGEARVDHQRFGSRADLSMAHPGQAAAVLAARHPDGTWRFDADLIGTGPFTGMDYHELGPDNAFELGTCARRAYEVLRYARIAGDAEAYRQMVRTLELMEQFRVPRAAQVWEVPVHTPDILAAADAVDAYLEAYWFSGDERWLRDAVRWARAGLPFVYFWDDPQEPFLVGSSIPVFGATWYRGSWFGRPVQWNGLRYSFALLKLAEHDASYPWRQIAETIIRSALYQQDPTGENVALWPDNISAITSEKCAWLFGPRQILSNIYRLIGRDEEPATVTVGSVPERLHISSTAHFVSTGWRDGRLRVELSIPAGEQGVVLISNLARPDAVHLDGQPLDERTAVEEGRESGWRYDAGYGYLTVRIAHDGPARLDIDGAAYCEVERLPQPVDRIEFRFNDSAEGWQAAHHIADLAVNDGVLVGTISGSDPYLVRGMVQVRGDDVRAIRVRMRVSTGQSAQLFWTTQSSPGFTEGKQFPFAVQADGQFHEYRLEVGRHPQWSGQQISGLRIDPVAGPPSGEFAIDYVVGEP